MYIKIPDKIIIKPTPGVPPIPIINLICFDKTPFGFNRGLKILSARNLATINVIIESKYVTTDMIDQTLPLFFIRNIVSD